MPRPFPNLGVYARLFSVLTWLVCIRRGCGAKTFNKKQQRYLNPQTVLGNVDDGPCPAYKVLARLLLSLEQASAFNPSGPHACYSGGITFASSLRAPVACRTSIIGYASIHCTPVRHQISAPVMRDRYRGQYEDEAEDSYESWDDVIDEDFELDPRDLSRKLSRDPDNHMPEGDDVRLSGTDLSPEEEELAWEKVYQLRDESALVDCEVFDFNEIGAYAWLEGLKGFMPTFQFASGGQELDEEILGKTVPCKVMFADKHEGRLILSNRRAVFELEVHKVEVGRLVECKAMLLRPYGVICDVEGLQGLLPRLDISRRPSITPWDVFWNPSETFKAMVQSIDRDSARIFLNTKVLEPKPGDMIDNPELVFNKAEEMADKYRTQQEVWPKMHTLMKEGVTIECEVCSLTKGGATVQFEGMQAFLPDGQYASGEVIGEDQIGKRLPCTIILANREAERLVVSNLQAKTKLVFDTLELGQVVEGKVVSFKRDGAFVDIGGMEGLLHIKQISKEQILDQNVKSVLSEGAKIKAMIHTIDKKRRRFSLSTKELEPEPGDMINNPETVFARAEEMAELYQKLMT